MIESINYEMPTEYALQVAAGKADVAGVILRNNENGEIIKHLPKVNLDDATEVSRSTLKSAIDFLGNHKIGTGCAIIGIVGVAGYEGYEHIWIPYFTKEVREFNKVYKKYMRELELGILSEKSVDNLHDALTKLRNHKNYDKFKIKLSIKEMDILFMGTKELARKNKVSLTESELRGSNDSIIDIQKYLMTQKRIFKETA